MARTPEKSDPPKSEEKVESPSSHLAVPTSIFRDRTLKPLEALVEYLKEVNNLTYHQIAKLLNRNDRTIWTVYQRAKKKRK